MKLLSLFFMSVVTLLFSHHAFAQEATSDETWSSGCLVVDGKVQTSQQATLKLNADSSYSLSIVSYLDNVCAFSASIIVSTGQILERNEYNLQAQLVSLYWISDKDFPANDNYRGTKMPNPSALLKELGQGIPNANFYEMAKRNSSGSFSPVMNQQSNMRVNGAILTFEKMNFVKK